MDIIAAPFIAMSRSSLKVAVLLAVLAIVLSGCRKQPRAKVELPISGKLRLDGVTLVDTHVGKLTPGMSILMDKPKYGDMIPIPLKRLVAHKASHHGKLLE